MSANDCEFCLNHSVLCADYTEIIDSAAYSLVEKKFLYFENVQALISKKQTG